jgi:hypothetical protein
VKDGENGTGLRFLSSQGGLTSSRSLKILPGPGGKAQQKVALGDMEGVVQVGHLEVNRIQGFCFVDGDILSHLQKKTLRSRAQQGCRTGVKTLVIYTVLAANNFPV